ncbi:MAG TPA: glycosyltransferase [Bryobacteraceae bacterium]|jgi:1,2-diacylglycerol 3-beta-galactosyltransferase
MPVIDFVFFDAGGGHRSAANALKAAIEEQNRPWTVRLVNLQEALDVLDIFRKYLGLRLEDVYNLMLAKGWTLGSAQGLVAMHGIIKLYHRPQVKTLIKHWTQTKPDMVVSLVPNFNRSMFQAIQKVNPAIPYVTVLTDMADWPPHFWMEKQPKQYIVCGTPKAIEQARAIGFDEDHIFATSGMILRPKFYEPITQSREEGRKKLGLDPDLPTGIVLFGGQGSSVMVEIAERLGRSGLRLQLIMICGRNTKLAERLRSLQLPIPIHVEGFTSEVPTFMHLSDFLIGKPGPGSISEAIAMKLPVIVERNAFTLPQERYNAEWVEEREVGVVLKNFRAIGEAARKLIEPETLKRYQANVAAIHNRAVYEIPEILEKILARHNSQ